MGTARNHRRLETIEKSLTPRELVHRCIEERAKFNSAVEYAAWLAEDQNRAPVDRVLAQIASTSAEAPPGTKQSSGKLRRQQVAEVMFLFHLLRLLDREVRGLLGCDESRLATVSFGVLHVNHSITFGLVMLHLSDLLSRIKRRGDANLAAAVALTADAADEFRRCGSAFGVPEIGATAEFVRTSLCAVLINVRATIAAIERLCTKYFKGLQVVFKSDANALDMLAKRAAGLVSDYDNLAELLAAIPIDSGVIERADKIDHEQIEQAVGEKAVDLAEQWVALAHAETLLLLEGEEHRRRALKLLDRYLRPRSAHAPEGGGYSSNGASPQKFAK